MSAIGEALICVAAFAACLISFMVGWQVGRHMVLTPRSCWLRGHRSEGDDYWLRRDDRYPLALAHRCARCKRFFVTFSDDETSTEEALLGPQKLREAG